MNKRNRLPHVTFAMFAFAALTLLLGLVASAPTRAASTVTPTTITKVGIYSGTSGATGVYVYFSPGVPNLEGCSNAIGNEIWIDSHRQRSRRVNHCMQP